VPVLLQEIRGSEALLQVDGQLIKVPIETMEQHWFGEYRLLWKTPPAGSPVLRPGDRSPDIKWLREKLKLATGLSSIAPDPLFFDEGLKTLVQGFQRSHELSADGIVGGNLLAAFGGRFLGKFGGFLGFGPGCLLTVGGLFGEAQYP
jgi:general secretion pathway protein A